MIRRLHLNINYNFTKWSFFSQFFFSTNRNNKSSSAENQPNNEIDIRLLYKEQDCINDEFLTNQHMKTYIKSLGSLPVNSYAKIEKEITEPPFFSKKMYFRILAQNQFKLWQQMYANYLTYIAENNIEQLDKFCEKTLVIRNRPFLEQFQATDLMFKVFKPKDIQNQVIYLTFQGIKIIDGVSIVRSKNKHASHYFKKSSGDTITYDPIGQKKDSKFNLLRQLEQKLEEEDKKIEGKFKEVGKKLNQYQIEVQSNVRLNIYKKTGELIYGSEDEKIFSNNLMQIENNRDHFSQTDYTLTDFDFQLQGNSFVQEL